MADIFEPIILDSTGQDIVNKLVTIGNNLNVLPEVIANANDAKNSAQNAKDSENNAAQAASDAKQYRDEAAAIVTPEGLAQEVIELKEDLTQLAYVVNGDITDTGTFYFKANIVYGKKYRLTNLTLGNIACTTRETQSGENVQDLGNVAPNTSIEFTSTHNASFLRAYAVSSGSIKLEDLTAKIPVIEARLDELWQPLSIQGNSGETIYSSLNLKAGETIIIKNTTSGVINARTRNTPTGTNIETIGDIRSGETTIYTLQNDAILLGFYYSTNGNVIVDRGLFTSIEKNEQLLSNISHRFVIGVGEKYTTLRSGIAEAIKYPHSYVFVKDGVYDLCNEFSAEINASTSSKYGIKLGNDVHVVFSSGATVTALHQGNDANVERYFNPFYTDNSGYTIENLNIKASNCRYCIHDENGGFETPRTVKILNCQFDFDNTNGVTKYYPQCIGGGNGKHDYIEIRGCYFKSKVAESTPTQIVSYHQDGASNEAQSNIYVSDCYFADKGTFRVTYYGTTTKVSKAYITNCSLGSIPYAKQEVESDPAPINYELISWNNEIH